MLEVTMGHHPPPPSLHLVVSLRYSPSSLRSSINPLRSQHPLTPTSTTSHHILRPRRPKQRHAPRHHHRPPKNLRVQEISIPQIDQPPRNWRPRQTRNANRRKHHPDSGAHFPRILGQAADTADEQTLHGVGEKSVEDDEGNEAVAVVDKGPEVEEEAGEEDGGNVDVQDATAAGDDEGREDATGNADSVEGHDEVERLGSGDVDDCCAKDGDLWGGMVSVR